MCRIYIGGKICIKKSNYELNENLWSENGEERRK